MKNKIRRGSFIFLGLSLIIISGSLFGCGKKYNDADNLKKKTITYDTREIPRKIATNSPLVIEFIRHFNLDVNTIADVRYFPNNSIKLVDKTVIMDRNMSFTQVDKIAQFNPITIFLENNVSDVYKYFGKYIKIVDISIEKGNYFESLKKNWIRLGLIFDKEKEAKYEVLKLEEYIKLVEEEVGDKVNVKLQVDNYFKKLIDSKDKLIDKFVGIDVKTINDTSKYVLDVKKSLDEGIIIGSPVSYKDMVDELYKTIK